MTYLVDWYNKAEESGEYSPIELAALFHYRYIRIHPFEDGNDRIARLIVNFILARHDYPMVVVRSRKKKDYLEALHQADLVVGPVPSDGSHASLRDARHFVNWFRKMMTEPGITIAALAKAIGINTSAIQKHLKSMTDKGYIARREKGGQWDVFIIPSA